MEVLIILECSFVFCTTSKLVNAFTGFHVFFVFSNENITFALANGSLSIILIVLIFSLIFFIRIYLSLQSCLSMLMKEPEKFKDLKDTLEMMETKKSDNTKP